MSPSRPYHINHPHRYADGSVHEDDQYYEVVGHRDGPVVARFYFYPDDPETEKQALKEAESLRDRNTKEFKKAEQLYNDTLNSISERNRKDREA